MIVVGLTGEMGSGKTTVLNMFNALGASTYIADVEAKKLMNNSVSLKKQIIEEFGTDSYKDGILNRSYLSQVVFNDPIKLKTLNSLVHPAVHDDFNNFVNNSNGPYIVYESALLLQGSMVNLFNYIIIVTAPRPVRMERILKRDTIDLGEIKKRLQHQSISKDGYSKAHFKIENIDENTTKNEVLEIHKQILSANKIIKK